MKKLLACLLALLLPCCAVAETQMFDWSIDVDKVGLSELFDVLEAALDAEDTSPFYDEWIAALAECISSFSWSFQTDLDGERQHMSVAYGDEELMSLDTTVLNETEAAFTTSLLPGFLMTLPYTSQAESLRLATEAWQNLDGAEVENTFSDCVSAWIDTLGMTEEYGAFVGDAYTGGELCWTIRFDERDVSVLLDSLSRAPWPEGIAQLLRYYGMLFFEDEDGVPEFLRTCAHELAMRNQYNYVLRLIIAEENDAYELIGLSMLFYEKNELVATLSVGLQDEVVNTVLGYGVHGQNVYLATAINTPENEDVNFHAKFWVDADRNGYSIASSEPSNLLFTADGTFSEGEAGPVAEIAMTGPALLDHLVHITLSSTITEQSGTYEASVTLNGHPLGTERITVTKTEDLPPLDTEELQDVNMLDLSDEEMQIMTQIVEQTTVELVFRLFKLIPARLMTVPLTPGFLFQ